MDWAQQAAKFCVGVVQDWITVELAIRIRSSKGSSEISEKIKQKLHRTSCIIFAILTLAFLAFSLAVIVTARIEENQGMAFI